jgi:HEPN domain-containing protein
MRPPDEVKKGLIRQWQSKADDDLGVAHHLAAESVYFTAVAFHAQQAAEKYLKAFLVEHQVEFPKTHDLDELLDLVSTIDEGLSDSIRDAALLSQYGVEVRYPGDGPELTEDEARRAVILAEGVRAAVEKVLLGT